jgi:trypsin
LYVTPIITDPEEFLLILFQNRNSGGTVVKVSSIKTYSGFNQNTLDGDVSIIKLATSIPTSSTIGYATLAAAGSDPASGSTLTVAGW